MMIMSEVLGEGCRRKQLWPWTSKHSHGV